jgi:Cu-Zn family superoxide dismutase
MNAKSILGAAAATVLASVALPAGQSPSEAAATPAAAPPAQVREASARVISRDGSQIGVVLFTQTAKGLRMDISLSRLVPGPHAVHIHSVGKCEMAYGFRSAGPHFDVGGHKHGQVAGGPHTGDMQNQVANKYGFIRATITTTAFTLGPGPTSLFDADGSSIVVHAGPDDYKTNPDGKAGDRVGCGVIKASS